MVENTARTHDFRKIVNAIARIISEERNPITNRELLGICREMNFAEDLHSDPHLPHELAETALNLVLQKTYSNEILNTGNPEEVCRERIRVLSSRLPVQSWRSNSQILLQQYSTPAPIGYLLAYLMGWVKGETVLEPSAGTGSLAVWATIAGLNVSVNEIEPRRRELLTLLGFSPTPHDGEFIHDLLSPDVAIDCIIMNPPFSSNGGRTKSNNSKFGFRHVESALERLKKGGKFGIVLGNAAGIDTNSGNEFWEKLSDSVSVNAIIKIDGREYYRNGTTVDINLIVGKKLAEISAVPWHGTRDQIKTVSVGSVEEAFHRVRDLGLCLDK